MIQNVQNQQTEYYLFSNDHLNNIAGLQFNFEDDEVLGYYINLLKTISLKLNETTVQFFFRCEAGSDDGSRFPLYSEAIKFVAHRDTMVRAAVKTLTLNVFGIAVPSLRCFLCSPPASQFFRQVAEFGAKKCLELHSAFRNYVGDTRKLSAAMEASLAEIEDVAAYCNDVLMLNVQELTSALMYEMWMRLIWPLLLKPSTTVADDGGRLTESLCSLYACERFLQAATEPQLASLIVMCLFGAPLEEASKLLNSILGTCASQEIDLLETGLEKFCCNSILMHHSAHLQDSRIVTGLVRLISAVLSHRTLPQSVRGFIGLLPRLRKRQLELVHKLIAEDGSGTASIALESKSSAENIESVCKIHNQDIATDSFDKIVTFLFGVLSLEFVPSSLLAEVGWMLNQLLSLGNGPLSMTTHWKGLLYDALESRKDSVLDMINIGPWADAILPLMKRSWESNASFLSRSNGSGTLHGAVIACVQSFMLRDMMWQLGKDRQSVINADYKVAAKMTVLSSASFATVVHISNYLYGNSTVDWPSQLSKYAIQPLTGETLNTAENIDASTLDIVVHCDVSFAKGVQRKVLLTIQKASFFPVLSIIEEIDSSPGRGTIISVAPLLACDPAIDQHNSCWMHFRVRPPLSSLLQSIDKSLSEVARLTEIDSVMTEGHWVLACEGNGTAAEAVSMVMGVDRKVRQQLYEAAESAFNDLILDIKRI